MFSIASGRYFLYSEPVDMRKGFNGLCGLINDRLKQNAMSGDVYIFMNRQRNRIKLLRWEPGGFVLFYKRLEKGTFELPQSQTPGLSRRLDYGELAMIITGISLKYATKRKRFSSQYLVNKTA
jgi:transposase